MQTFKAHTAVGTANHQQGLEAFTMHGRHDNEKWHMTNYRENNGNYTERFCTKLAVFFFYVLVWLAHVLDEEFNLWSYLYGIFSGLVTSPLLKVGVNMSWASWSTGPWGRMGSGSVVAQIVRLGSRRSKWSASRPGYITHNRRASEPVWTFWRTERSLLPGWNVTWRGCFLLILRKEQETESLRKTNGMKNIT